jgi:hypothetical protein
MIRCALAFTAGAAVVVLPFTLWALQGDLPLRPLRLRLEQLHGAVAAVKDEGNPSFACARRGLPCRQGGRFRIPWYGETFYDPGASLQQGLTFWGSPCQGYDLSSGSLACPIRADLQWQPICLTPNCRRFDVHVVVDVTQSSGWRWLDNLAPIRSFHWNIPWKDLPVDLGGSGKTVAQQ